MGSAIRAIIFDIGRVIVRVNVERAMSELAAQTVLTPAELWAAIEKDPRWRDWQEGRLTPHDWYLHLGARLGIALSFEDFCAAWNRALDPQPILQDGLFMGLARNYRLALLSNTDPIHVAHMESNFSFVSHFPHRVYSCAAGATKPNPLIFREALQACRAKAPEAVYIDDIEEYVEAARRLGARGIRFQSGEQLRSELTALGVKLA